MPRPMARQAGPGIVEDARYMILDGYVDEPASLGVPPYLSPGIRSLAGGLVSGGAKENEIQYLTIDQWRDLRGRSASADIWRGLEVLIIMKGCVVPGRYIRGTPVSQREVLETFSAIKADIKVITGAGSGGPVPGDVEICSGDPGVLGESISSSGRVRSGRRNLDEWNRHLIYGAFICGSHPDFPSPLICEVETSEGCPRFVSGGCSFCLEPGKGSVVFREPADIISEIEVLSDCGVENIRIGGQSDLLSYLSPDVGKRGVPEPDPEPLDQLMRGVSRALHEGKGVIKARSRGYRTGIDTGIIHTDNANPAVIAAYPESSKRALRAIMKGITPGSVLALGLESSDPDVKASNNLNSGPEDVIRSVEIMNGTGGEKGVNGMPLLLPGINFLGGLNGQKGSSFRADLDLLEEIFRRGWMIRRINIRKVIHPEGATNGWSEADSRGMWMAFDSFRKEVRERYDPLFLGRMLPPGSVMKGVYVEARSGRTWFGRQIGSYPVLAGIPHEVAIGSFVDIAITEVSSRSVTGFRTPFILSEASFRDLTAIPGIGKKRAASVFRDPRPGNEAFASLSGSEYGWVLDHIR